MTTPRFAKWRWGICEWGINRLSEPGYCDKRARWYDSRTGRLLCGEHKRAAEQKASS